MSIFASEQFRLSASIEEVAAGRSLAESPGAAFDCPIPPSGIRKATRSFESWKGRKKAKTVVFAEEDDVLLVEKWIIPKVHCHNKEEVSALPSVREVHWDDYNLIFPVENWLQPDGHNQLSFPRTRYVRNVPDSEAEDLDGDIEMLDFDAPATSAAMDSLADCLSRLRVDWVMSPLGRYF